MTKASKKMMTTAIAATLVLGATGYAATQAFAATTDDSGKAGSSVAADANQTGKQGFGERFGGKRGGMQGDMRGHRPPGMPGGNLVQQTADILEIEASDIQSALEGGKTFAQIAEENGLSKDAYLTKLEALEAERIDELVSAGKIDEEQAADMKAQQAEHLTERIESTNPGPGRGMHPGGKGMPGFGHIEGIAEQLGVTEDELHQQLRAGQSLAEIAAAKGISEDELVAFIQDSMTNSIKEWVNHKQPAPPADASNTAEAETAS